MSKHALTTGRVTHAIYIEDGRFVKACTRKVLLDKYDGTTGTPTCTKCRVLVGIDPPPRQRMRKVECCAWALVIAIFWFIIVNATLYLVFNYAFTRATSNW